MTYPIVAYGHPNLRKIAIDIDKEYPDLDSLIASMYESMYQSNGVGLAAPQINKSIRLFVIDATAFSDEEEEVPEIDFKEVFLNAYLVEESGEKWAFNEGCLSIPGINEDIMRHSKVRIQYYDANWDYHDSIFEGVLARVIQHEYDHLQGKLFVDHLSTLRKTMLKGKLNDIAKGKTNADYRMIFKKPKKRK